jgi:ADP-heptose:LPS heptosyltransferase
VRWQGRCVVFNKAYRNQDHPGRIYPSDEARAWALKNVPAGCIIMECVVRRPSSPGKDWGHARWAGVARELSVSAPLVQLGADDARPELPGAQRIKTPTFWHAAAAIERAALVLTPEGGTHHMAGALGIPAVVVYGGFTHPRTTSYATETSLYADLPGSPCGRYDNCDHCRKALASITVDDVVGAARALYGATTGENQYG